MSPEEFRERAVGVPWVRWRSDWQAMDCYGCILLWHREVLGIDLSDVPMVDMARGFEDGGHAWVECSPEDGATVFFTFRDGAAVHCGVLISSTHVLHSEGSQEHPGNVRVSSLRSIKRMYGTLKTMRHVAHH